MIRIQHALLLLCIAIAIPASVFAAESVRFDRDVPQSFNDLYQQALKTNPAYRSSWEEQILARYTLYRAWGNFLPGVTASSRFSTTHSTDNSASTLIGVRTANTSSSSYGVSASLPIWDGGARYGTLDNARLAVKSAPIILTDAEWQLSYGLHAALNAAVATSEMVRAARSSVAVKQELLRLADAKYKLGATTEIDVLSTQVQLNNAETTLLQAVQDSTIARVKLNQLIGVDPTSRYPLAEISDKPYELSEVESIVEEAKARSPQGMLAKFNLQKSKNDNRIAQATWWPEIDLSSSLNWSNSANTANFYTLNSDYNSRVLALSLSYPIFTGFQRAQTRETAKVTLKQSNWDYRGKMLQLEESVRENYDKLVRAKQLIVTSTANVELARRQRELEQERYRVGSSTLLLVQNALDAELNSQIQLIQNRLNERTSRALLEYTIGRPLPEK